ncbi:MAG: hypothetical protein HUU55_15830 [Myxococcales bacterium]|nr:hypothetical protein [Myxococcales bacterium]
MTSQDTLSYIRTVEQLFLVLRRQGLMLSPLDMQLAKSWADANIPLRVVCRAIIDSCDRYKQRFGSQRPLPTSLRYFGAAVVEEAEKQQAHHFSQEIFDADPAETRNNALTVVDHLIEELILIGQSEPEAVVRTAYRNAYRGLIRLRQDLLSSTPPALLPRLDQLDTQLMNDVWQHMSDDLRNQVEEATQPQIETLRGKLGVMALAEHHRMLKEEWLVQHLGLFRLWDPGRKMPPTETTSPPQTTIADHQDTRP